MAFGIDDSGKFINIFGVKDGADAPLFTFKGTKATVSELPASGTVGDVWVVTAVGHKYAWDGSNWKDIGTETPDLSNYVQKTDKATVSNLGLVKPDGTTITINSNGVISSQGGQGGEVIDIGSYQESYHGYVIPKVTTVKAQEIYNKHKAGTPVVIKWTLLGTETYLNIISADYVAGVYSLDVALHNQYHIAYSWEDTATTYCLFEVNEGVMEDVVTEGESGTLADDEIALINNDANIINDGEKYYLSNKLSTLTYRTYINTDVGTSTNLTAKAIYVQLNEEAVNYGTWSKEELSAGGGANIDLSNLSSDGETKILPSKFTPKQFTILNWASIPTTGTYYTVSLSEYLPNDNYYYEVAFQGSVELKNSDNTSYSLETKGSGDSGTIIICGLSGNGASNKVKAGGNGTLLIKPDTKEMQYICYGASVNTIIAYLKITGYRKVK